jgi:hypothetical protein
VTTPNASARLEALRDGLLAVHKTLLGIARADYEKTHGPVAGPGALLHLLINDAAFAWLHPVSELAARSDELLEEEEIPDAELVAIARTAAELLTPNEDGTGFAKKYFDAIQSEPDVVIAHVSARRAIAALAPTTH